jgi:hypothetical protein
MAADSRSSYEKSGESVLELSAEAEVDDVVTELHGPTHPIAGVH